MIQKILISLVSLSNSLLLILMLLLGSQNLTNKHSVNLGLYRSEPMPTGFLIGMSIALGSISGGLTTILLLQSRKS